MIKYDTGGSGGGYVITGSSNARSCGCVGPQNGQPLCPCQMVGVEVRNGRYVRVQDLGPVRGTTNHREGWGGFV